MKKLIATLLAITLLATLATTALAADFFPGSDLTFGTGSPEWDVQPDNELSTSYYSIAGQTWTKGKDLVSSVRIDNNENALIVTLKPDYTSKKEKPLVGTIKVRDKKKGVFLNVTIDCMVGYNQATIDIQPDGAIPTLNVEPDTVYTVKATDKAYPYGTLMFHADNADVSVRVYDDEVLFLEYTREPDREILKANADNDAVMEFLNFKAHPSFSSTATLSFYGLEKDHYVYEVKNGRLSRVNSTWDKDMESHVIKTRTLTNYVVSDKPLKSSNGTTDNTGNNNNNNTGTNPDTGANDVAGIAMALAIVSGVSAAAISLKKSK